MDRLIMYNRNDNWGQAKNLMFYYSEVRQCK